MKKLSGLICIALTAAMALAVSGCGAPYDRTTFVLHKDGSAKQYIIDTAYADTPISELRDYVEHSIDDYLGDSEQKTIKLDKCDIDGGKVDIELSYDTCADYAAYNDVICFDGTPEEAQAAGYDLDRQYVNSEGAELSFSEAVSFETDQEIRVLIMNEVTAVELPGTFIAATDNVSADEHGRLNTEPDTDESIPEQFRTINYDIACFIYAV